MITIHATINANPPENRQPVTEPAGWSFVSFSSIGDDDHYSHYNQRESPPHNQTTGQRTLRLGKCATFL